VKSLLRAKPPQPLIQNFLLTPRGVNIDAYRERLFWQAFMMMVIL